MLRKLPLVFLLVGVAAAGAVCTCQRAENIEAKQRLSKPAPPDPHVKAADDKIDVDKLEDPAVMKRVVHMEGQEIAARLKSFSWQSTGELVFTRGEGARVRSFEKTRMQQADNGDFAVETTTGDGSEQKLAYVNEVFFLKNNNGKWRIDRDPQGERNAYRTDSLAVWRAFYDLIGHALVVEKLGVAKHDGREVMRYKLSLPDKGSEARAAGASIPAPPVGPDGGPAEEAPAEHTKRIRDRMQQWRDRAKPAGGSGELWVDMDAAVVTQVKFNGAMLVGDGPEPAKLDVHIDASATDVGKPHTIAMPKDAIEEIVRKKMPVEPRAILEDEGIVPPLPKDGGPGAGGPGSKKKPAAQGVELPDDDDSQ
jgi:hypothetical protein